MAVCGTHKKKVGSWEGKQSRGLLDPSWQSTMTSPPGRRFCSLHLEPNWLYYYRDVFGDRWKLLDSSKGDESKEQKAKQ